MKTLVNLFCLSAFLAAILIVPTGCTTKNKAQVRAHQAFIAGQQQAIAQTQQTSNYIQVTGEVQNALVPWADGLTLAQAIISAEYRGLREPREILIYRQGQMIAINPKALLRGADELLEPGDRIILR